MSAKGFTLIELLVVIVILGVLAAVVIFAVGSVRDRAETNACKTDTKTLKTAIAAWNTEYVGDNPDYTTAYPTSMGDLTTAPTKLIQEPSSLHTLTANAGGDDPPTIGKASGKCADEGTITQFT
ncbi:MAG: prepilin-type N-terminal cleavage/methylation domain-containing protein [Acidimicrobiales bacterium]|nr:prepilin-type N-terminal cleavage/methylation domain-containing protein [Acidimicrobiales bacterium]